VLRKVGFKMSRELLKRALDALKTCDEGVDDEVRYRAPRFDSDKVYSAIDGIESALDKPLPEPVGFAHYEVFENYLRETGAASMACKKPASDNGYKIPLYAEPPARRPLTDDERDDVFRKATESHRNWTKNREQSSGGQCFVQKDYFHTWLIIETETAHGITDTEQSKPQSNAI
jgi:hypothetical protein